MLDHKNAWVSTSSSPASPPVHTTIMVFYNGSGVSYGNSLHTVYPTIDLLYVFVQNSTEAFRKRLGKNIKTIFFPKRRFVLSSTVD